MSSHFNRIMLTDSEISEQIKKHVDFKSIGEPYVYIPDIQKQAYTYNDITSSEYSLPVGFNIDDEKLLGDMVFVLTNDKSTNALSTLIKGMPVVGLNMGSIVEIDYNVNLMVGDTFESDFQQVFQNLDASL